MKLETIEMRWSDGSEAVVNPPKGGWLRFIVENPDAYTYCFGHVSYPLEDKPFHMACVYPTQLKQLALNELQQLQEGKP